ncbi:arylamine N-acetyltransferase family protein [Novosphingobium guangzhouense]|uniref:arylamine N-acetyltransferase family protein n=1 Tax=Novosphingobium guangzhouense TaxID=1850347 RepID=UPI000CCC6333|nr:arylamine N-acetyltransferase [Novosphingobium guangzhouense]
MNFDQYLGRIGLSGAPSATPQGVATLQAAHRRNIGFENLDAMLQRPIRIDPQSVFDKLVVQGRGGYCFEHNRLFSDALTAVGVRNRPLLARVRLGQPEDAVPPRTHTCLLLLIDGRPWVADAGFGGSDLAPLPLEEGVEVRTADGARHRLRRTGERGTFEGEWLLERAGPASATDGRAAQHGDWQPQYVFDLSDVAPDDLEQANHWASTRAQTRFTTLHVASIPHETGFASMVDRTLTIYGAAHGEGGTRRREIAGPADYADTLRTVFRIDLTEQEAASLPLFC